MQISVRPMTADEAWKYILERHTAFHNSLKKFGYKYNTWVPKPNNEHIKAMFEKEKLSDQEIVQYKEFFINNIYNVEDLKRYNEHLNSFVVPMLERGVKKFLVPLLPSWGAKLPDELTILCTYGSGASYSEIKGGKATITFRISRYPDNKQVMLETMLHEFIHIMIEQPIIRKYDVPQDLKERIVDIIGFELFDKVSVQERFANSFANAYITPETIKTDLPGAVRKMMTDYKILHQKQMQQGQSL